VILEVHSSSDDFVVADHWWTVETRDGPVELQGRTVPYNFQHPGTYGVSLKVTDAVGNWCIDTLTVTVVDTEPPTANAGHDIEIDQGTDLTLNASRSTDNAGVVGWTWTFEYGGHNVTLEGEKPSFTFDVPGTYILVLMVEDDAGLSDNDDLEVTVRDTEDPIAIVQGDVAVEAGKSLNLDASNSTDNVEISLYGWTIDGPDGLDVKTGMNVSYTFKEPGNYTVELVVTDSSGNTGEASFKVEVTPSTGTNGDGGVDLGGYPVYAIIAAVVIVVVVGLILLLRMER
jgi:PKD repeat protein